MFFDTDSWQEIYYTLRKNKLRSFLTAFGVFWGIFMLIIMLGSGNGLKNGALEDFSRFASNSVYLWARNTTIPYKGFPKGRRFRLKNSDIQALQKNIPEIGYIAPRNELRSSEGVNNVTHGLKTGTYNIYGD